MKYLKDRIRSIFRLDDTPHKIAFAFALGVFVAFTPTFGLHILTCLLFAWAFRLSKFVAITGAFLNNPWTIVPLYGFCLWLGIKITGSTAAAAPIAWSDLTLMTAFAAIKPYLWPFVAGTLVAGLVSAVVSYGLVFWAVKRYRRTEQKYTPPGS